MIYSSGLLAVLLDKSGYKWAIPVIPLLGLPPFILSNFCAIDPPSQPTFTLAETNAILQLDFGAAFQSGLQKLRDLVANRVWYELCRCDVGVPTGPSAPQVPPVGTPYTLPPVTTVAPCVLRVFPAVPLTGSSSLVWSSAIGYLGREASSIRIPVHSQILTGAGVTVHIEALQYDDSAGHVLLRTDAFNLAPGASAAPIYPVANSNALYVTAASTGGAGIVEITGQAEVFCHGALPGGERGPCECGPDPVVLGMLEQILGMVTLVQRQAVPFGVIAAAEHTGLTGAGELSIEGLIGLQVTLTTVPAFLGHLVGHPDVIFDAGFITWGDAAGWRETERITHTPFQTFPRAAGAATRVGYSFEVGVVASIREISREP